jgi:hypothetical protein
MHTNPTTSATTPDRQQARPHVPQPASQETLPSPPPRAAAQRPSPRRNRRAEARQPTIGLQARFPAGSTAHQDARSGVKKA